MLAANPLYRGKGRRLWLRVAWCAERERLWECLVVRFYPQPLAAVRGVIADRCLGQIALTAPNEKRRAFERNLSSGILNSMFTGLIETLGEVLTLNPTSLGVRPREEWSDRLEIGESIAVNGTCLTVVEGSNSSCLNFDISPETFNRTSLGALKQGSVVNLERAMKLNDRLGGHLVQGHVDTTGHLVAKVLEDQFSIFTFQAPPIFDRYLIDKGSIAVDGISLTVVTPVAGRFNVWIIPATLTHTNLQGLEVGNPVNLEFDLISKYVEKLALGRV